MLTLIFLTQISWGTITKLRCPICSQKALGFRNTCFYCSIHSFAKNHSSPATYLLLNFISAFKTNASMPLYIKALRQESSYLHRQKNLPRRDSCMQKVKLSTTKIGYRQPFLINLFGWAKRFCFPRFRLCPVGKKRATFLLLFRSLEKVNEQKPFAKAIYNSPS